MSNEKFARIAVLPENWDSYGAPRVSADAIRRAARWLESVAVVPCSDGGVQLEWHSDGVDFEIVFSANGDIEAWMEGIDGVQIPAADPHQGERET